MTDSGEDKEASDDPQQPDPAADPLKDLQWATLDSQLFNFEISYPSSIFAVRDTKTGHVLETQEAAMARLHSSTGPLSSNDAARSLSVKFETYGSDMVETTRIVLPGAVDEIYPDGTTSSFKEQDGTYSFEHDGREAYYHVERRDGSSVTWTLLPKSPSLTFVMTFTNVKYGDLTEQDLEAVLEQMLSSLVFTR